MTKEAILNKHWALKYSEPMPYEYILIATEAMREWSDIDNTHLKAEIKRDEIIVKALGNRIRALEETLDKLK